MNLAYLILAHNNPKHLQKLINSLDTSNVHFFVHVDNKSDILPFQATISSNKVTFIPERSNIFWGEFSMVKATIDLMKTALDTQIFDYLILISGSDYPLKNAQYIKYFFAKNKGSEFINLVEIPNEQASKNLNRLYQYRISFSSKNIFLRVFRRIINCVINDLFHWRRNYKKALGELKPYAGSQWWALSGDACSYILNFIARNPEILKFFRTALIPDESFFHTILANSDFITKVKPNLTFTKWSDSAHPEYITIEIVQNFQGMDAIYNHNIGGYGEVLFARKFATNSEEVIKFIDDYIA
ncbi:beta-1,6-N-acetylglucosaminyltransferase [Nostoc parmelioides]|nr:beta-1,6-N-acetylglucosaminyltransferase [Nostoc parmelioides]